MGEEHFGAVRGPAVEDPLVQNVQAALRGDVEYGDRPAPAMAGDIGDSSAIGTEEGAGELGVAVGVRVQDLDVGSAEVGQKQPVDVGHTVVRGHSKVVAVWGDVDTGTDEGAEGLRGGQDRHR